MKSNLFFSIIYMARAKKALTIFTLILCVYTKAQTIITVAGTGISGFSGDNGQATLAKISGVNGIIFDPAGNMYFSDISYNRVRKISPSGVITTVAGNGSTTYNTDGVQATATGLNSPAGLALDASGNLYIADQYNYCVRKVNTAGVITTVAGNGSSTYNGDGMSATSSGLYNPSGVAVDPAGNLYIADVLHNRIRKVNASGIISTVAGTGTQGYTGDNGLATSATLNRPYAITLDAAGNLYIADDYNNCVRKVNASGIITTIAGNGSSGYSGDGGPATAAKMSLTSGVAVDGTGNVYITDYNNHRIRKVDTFGMISTLAGNGTPGYNGDNILAASAKLNYPIGLACDTIGNIYIGDSYNNRLRKVLPGVTTSINSLSKETNILIYPNPVKDFINIKSNAAILKIIIRDIVGRIIFEMTPIDQPAKIDVENFNNGVYILSVYSENYLIKQEKLIIEKLHN